MHGRFERTGALYALRFEWHEYGIRKVLKYRLKRRDKKGKRGDFWYWG